jgi:uncharacterized membrane protein
MIPTLHRIEEPGTILLRMAGDEDPPPGSDLARLRRAQRSVRLGGEDFGRILALSDGIFAFAMTLLALSLTVPIVHGSSPGAESGNLLNRLLSEGNVFFGYAFAFVMIAVWWMVHNRTFQYLVRYDSTLVWLNMIVLVQIAIMPFVLSVYNTYDNLQVGVDLFAVIQITLGLTSVVLWEYARSHRLMRSDVPDDLARYFTARGAFTTVIFGVSIAVSFVSVTGAQLCWIAILVAQRFADRATEQKA